MNAVRSIVRALRINTRAIESQMGISLAQLFVLQQLADRPANSLNELAERTATHQRSVSVVVRRLVDNGYVSRTTPPTTAADRDRRHPRDAACSLTRRLSSPTRDVARKMTASDQAPPAIFRRWPGREDRSGVAADAGRGRFNRR